MSLSRAAIVVLVVSAAGSAGCGKPQRIKTVERPGQDLILLLPDSESGTTGRVIVSNSSGTTELAVARAATRVATNAPPAPASVLSEARVKELFGPVLSTLPPPPRHFTLYFRFDSDDLTDESKTLLARVLQAVKNRPVPDVLVVGHTDTAGTPSANYQLGLRRANTVRGLLVNAGLDASFVEVTSHGEADLLIKTQDGVPEPRNRRVEIAVR